MNSINTLLQRGAQGSGRALGVQLEACGWVKVGQDRQVSKLLLDVFEGLSCSRCPLQRFLRDFLDAIGEFE